MASLIKIKDKHMKIKDILNESTVPSVFTKLFKSFPIDAASWKNATDEVRDISKLARETYNEFQQVDGNDEVIQSLNFRSFKTPSDWNSKSQDFIVMCWNKMNAETKREFLRQAKSMFPKFF